MNTRVDPFMNFRFVVEFDHIQHGGFNKVKGVAREVKVETYHEGGENAYEHKLASNTTYGNLTLERGLADDFLSNWNQDASDGQVRRRDITVILRDGSANEVWRWLVASAFPVKWTGADLDGSGAQVLVESVEFAHHGIRKG
ncbi:phage tail protein [Microvirga splendida]|uniref:Phage tail protein n=1 Tax=Microvirga splendida TaxID=2795727 RepID=A0ABS0Y4I6_9HYPH|nr:phage tail protein [Microvirga splendida]MBJ6127189.1 phage tail protein [Microvirga splendida]